MAANQVGSLHPQLVKGHCLNVWIVLMSQWHLAGWLLPEWVDDDVTPDNHWDVFFVQIEGTRYVKVSINNTFYTLYTCSSKPYTEWHVHWINRSMPLMLTIGTYLRHGIYMKKRYLTLSDSNLTHASCEPLTLGWSYTFRGFSSI